MVGEMGSIVLKGSRISSEKITKAGFSFKFTSLESAFRNLLIKN
jgi:NAD dependent epimerase/dehydratase family enzyme